MDISDDFAAVGVPGGDPFGTRDADLAHLNAKGHALLAQVVRDGLGFLPPAVNGVMKATATTAAVPSATHAGLPRDSSAVASLDDLKVAV